VRGFVVGLRAVAPDSAPARLKDVAARSGTLAVFDERMLETLRWAAIHYVGPLATVLGRTTPPNVPRPPKIGSIPGLSWEAAHPLPDVAQAALRGAHVRPTAWVGAEPWDTKIASLIGPIVAGGRNVMVVLPTSVEAHRLAAGLSASMPGRVVEAGSALSARDSTRAWAVAATTPGIVLVGTREVALWRVTELSLAVVVEEGRRAMKSPQSPTLHVREILRRRAAIERFPMVVVGAVPTTEMVAAGSNVVSGPGRTWRLVEVVDRREDLDPAALVTERVRQAVRSVAGRGGRVFCLVHRRGYAPAFRCVKCGEIRRCAACGAAVDRDGSCRRCHAVAGACPHCGGTRFAPLGAGVGRVVDDIRRSVGDAVGTPDDRAGPSAPWCAGRTRHRPCP